MQEQDSINQCAESLSTLSCVKSAEQLSVFANLLAIAISKGKSTDQMNVIGNFIVGIGGLVLTMAAQMQACETTQDKLKQIQELKKQLKAIEDSLR